MKLAKGSIRNLFKSLSNNDVVDEDELYSGDDFMPLPDMRSIRKARLSMSGKIAPGSISDIPPFSTCSSQTQTTFVGYSKNANCASAVASLCEEALTANPDLQPSICMMFSTQGTKVNRYEVTDGVRDAFPECESMQILFSQMSGTFAEPKSGLWQVSECDLISSATAVTKDLFCMVLLQEPGLFSRAFFVAPCLHSPADSSIDSCDDEIEDTGCAAQLENMLSDTSKNLNRRPLPQNGFAAVIITPRGKVRIVYTVSNLTAASAVSLSFPDIAGTDTHAFLYFCHFKQIEKARRHFMCEDVGGGFQKQPQSNVNKPDVVPRTLYASTQNVQGHEGIFGIEMLGDATIRCSILLGIHTDKMENLEFAKRVKVFKRRIEKQNETDGPSTPILMFGLVCAGRTAKQGFGHEVDFDAVSKGFPNCPKIGVNCWSEVLPKHNGSTGNEILAFSSTWVLIERLSNPEKRVSFKNIVVC